MPHITVDFGGIPDTNKIIEDFYGRLVKAYSKSDALVPENVKLRGNIFDCVRVAGKPSQFVHISVALMRGPSKDQQSSLSQLLWDAAADFFPEIEQITVEIREMEPLTYRKRISRAGR